MWMYKRRVWRGALIVSYIFIVGCAESSKRVNESPLQTVAEVEVDRYLGLWYEIARFPFSIQEGCWGTTAIYTRRSDGKIDVLNECRLGSIDGERSRAHGKAWIVDSETNAKLKVSFNFFMGLFGGGDYWIIDLARDYSYSVVSEPKGRYLWILSRTPRLDDEVYAQILARLKADGFLIEYLEKTVQP